MPKNEIRLRSYAKINLCLDVIGKRPDGYHELISVMQSVSLYDKIYIKKVFKDDYLKIVTNLRHLPGDKRNIVYRAIDILKEKHNISTGIFVDIEKSIPVSAGLGGGSSNCATAITGMKELFSLPMNIEEMTETGKSLGADVPFFFIKHTALAKGIGDLLTPLPSLPPCYFVLIKPPIIVSTAEVFKKYNIKKRQSGFDIEKMLYHIKNADIQGICDNFYNALEDVTATEFPIIHEIKNELLNNGASGALMSGSGPTVFGCFIARSEAEHAAAAISKKFQDIKDIFVTKNL